MQDNLLPKEKNFELVRITDRDVKAKTDWLLDFRQFILRNEGMYPRIEAWLDRKVYSGLKSGERVGYIGLCDERPVASAVLKRGRTAKFCHLRLEESIQKQGLGELFFILMTLETRHKAKRVNFTLPESLWNEKKEFFGSFGFVDAKISKRQYRLFDEELFCSAPFSTVFSTVRQKLPKMVGRLSIGKHSLLTPLLISLNPTNAEKILSGSKSVEIRRRFSKDWENKRATLYASKPVGALVGEAIIARVISGHPESIWRHFGHLAGCKREQYDAYVGDLTNVYALVLNDVAAFAEQVPITQLSYLLDESLRPPQSYLRLTENAKWSSAVSLAAALQSSLGARRIRPPQY